MAVDADTQGRTYYRSIIRYGEDGEAFIKQPSDDLHPDALYEIRDEDKKEVLGKVKGSDLIEERRVQLERYLKQGDGTRTNISLVDVSSLI